MVNRHVSLNGEREIKSNQNAMECIKCCYWLHKGSSGPSSINFNKAYNRFEKTVAPNWKCTTCKQSDIKQVSLWRPIQLIHDINLSTYSQRDLNQVIQLVTCQKNMLTT